MTLCRQSYSRLLAAVKNALEVGRHSLSMMLIMNAGTTLRIIPIILEQKFESEGPASERAVEMEYEGQHYHKVFDRARPDTAVEDPRTEQILDDALTTMKGAAKGSMSTGRNGASVR